MKHVVKRAGHVQLYDPKKLYNSIYAAALSVREPIEVAHKIADEVVAAVEVWLHDKQEFTSHDLRRKASEHLRVIHPEAAQVYSHHKVAWE